MAGKSYLKMLNSLELRVLCFVTLKVEVLSEVDVNVFRMLFPIYIPLRDQMHADDTLNFLYCVCLSVLLT